MSKKPRYLQRLVRHLVCLWLRWRYGGDVMALKPPPGFHPIYSPRPLWWRVRYYLRKAVWKVECLAFELWGQDMRAGWFHGQMQAAWDATADVTLPSPNAKLRDAASITSTNTDHDQTH